MEYFFPTAKILVTMPLLTHTFRLTIFLTCFISLVSSAQDSLRVELQSPYHTVVNHLKYLQEDNYHPELSLQSFDFSQSDYDLEQKKLVARKLKQIFDGRGEYIDPELLPTSTNFTDTVTSRQKFVVVKELPQVYLYKVGNKWLYSAETVKAIPELFEETYHSSRTSS